MSDSGLIYCDGGVAKSNPSPICGTWAWIHVGADGVTVDEVSGVLLPEHLGQRTISNNDSEAYAVLRALESLPDGWSGDIHSDSMCTLTRYQRILDCRGPSKTMHPELYERAELAVERLGPLRFLHLKGHPTRADLERGCDKRGRPVSHYQARCDRLCTEAAAAYVELQQTRRLT